jgi:SAM-dependent methyltransferase
MQQILEQEHWNEVYGSKPADKVSWFQTTPNASLTALDRFQIQADSAFIDVGGGASNLVDALLERGWSDLTVLDLAKTALDIARERIGRNADRVRWLVADVTRWTPGRAFDVWHDRAVFHFLVKKEDREAYRKAFFQALRPGGIAIIATFALDGPDRCSGLPVQRYDAGGLAREFGPEFERLADWREEHVTPSGTVQPFTWVVLRRRKTASELGHR